MPQKLPRLFLLIFGIFCALYSAQAAEVLHRQLSTSPSVVAACGESSHGNLRALTHDQLPANPFIGTAYSGGIIGFEELNGSMGEGETEDESEAPDEARTGDAQYPFGNQRLESQAKEIPHKKGVALPLYLLLGNIREHDCPQAR